MLVRRRFIFSSFLILSVCLSQRLMAQEKDLLSEYREKAMSWEKDIAAWEKSDQTEVAGDSTLLFLGSSSIRRWQTLSTDIEPWKAIGRGYGGAKFSDLAIYAPRLLAAHHPKGVVVYVGNDITGKAETDKKPEEIVRLFGIVVDAIKKQAPQAEIFLIAITPAPSRFAAWPKIQTANSQLQEFCKKHTKLHFIETHSAYLTTDGQPRPELYVEDRLHQNEVGYKLWSGIIRKELESVYGKSEPSSK
ncbi:MAG: GDSL-type esterase/lipase family protein [Pirellulaceae bacterium]|nr:GDSL-type esterase/lipase family protein [Pirellulaceae bacterium]